MKTAIKRTFALLMAVMLCFSLILVNAVAENGSAELLAASDITITKDITPIIGPITQGKYNMMFIIKVKGNLDFSTAFEWQKYNSATGIWEKIVFTGNAASNAQYGLRLENLMENDEYKSVLWANGIKKEAEGTYRCVISDVNGIKKTSYEASITVSNGQPTPTPTPTPTPKPTATPTPMSGTCGENLTWSLDDAGTLTISGTGDMYDYDSYLSRPSWDAYRLSIKDVFITSGVTSIGIAAFSSCYSLISVNIPDSIQKIERDAFFNCSRLSTIKIPNSVSNIGAYAFGNCKSIESINIPDKILVIDAGLFYCCSGLTSIVMSDSITSIELFAFSGCSSLNNIKFPKNLTSIGQNAFSQCQNLESVCLPESVTYIGEYAFFECSNLTGINIPAGVTTISDSTFSMCSRLTNLEISENVTTIDRYAFSQCESLSEVIIPTRVTKIGEYAFAWCSMLEKAEIPDGVTSIENNTFGGCTSLVNIKIPDSVTYIGSCAFAGCSNLSEIKLPKRITNMENAVFENCSSLTSIVLPENVTDIGANAFRNCDNLISIIIPDKVARIQSYAFFGCDKLKSIIIGKGVKTIDDYAFWYCKSLISLTMPISVTYIGNYAFDGCSKLANVYYAGSESDWSRIYINYYNNHLITANIIYNYKEFYYVSYNTTNGTGEFETQTRKNGVVLVLHEGVPIRIGYTFLGWATSENAVEPEYQPGSSYSKDTDVTLYAVWGRSSDAIVLPAALKKIEAEAFTGVTAEAIVVPEGVAEIGNRAFANCPNLRCIIFRGDPDSIDIDSDYLEGCKDVRIIRP